MPLDRNQQTAALTALSPIILVWMVNGVYLSALAKLGIHWFWLADMCQWIVLPAAAWWFLSRRANIGLKEIGFTAKRAEWPTVITGALAVLITTGIVFFLTRNVSWRLLGYPTGFFTFAAAYPEGILRPIVWLYSSLTAGFVESAVFIGLPWLLYASSKQTPSKAVFILLASIVFALVHWEQGPHVVIGAFFFHIVACGWFFYFRCLWPVAIGHALVDLVAFS